MVIHGIPVKQEAIQQLTSNDAEDLLIALAPNIKPSEAQELAEQCCNVPIALSVVAGVTHQLRISPQVLHLKAPCLFCGLSAFCTQLIYMIMCPHSNLHIKRN